MFAGEMDEHNAFLDVQAGSGGTEAQDWANMLYRMYVRWASRAVSKMEVLEHSPGEVAGIKSATVHVQGPYAYGWLRTRLGVHRLVRKSPLTPVTDATPRSPRSSSRPSSTTTSTSR